MEFRSDGVSRREENDDMTKKKKRYFVVAGALLLLAVMAAAGMLLLGSESGEDDLASTGRESGDQLISYMERGTIPDFIKKEQGARPNNSRLRDGNVQAMNDAAALTSAKKALDRVEQELAEAKSADERERLESKKALIMQAFKW